MAYDGSGTFSRLFNWEADRDGGIKIRADRMDSEMDGMATGLSTAITKDGQTTITANLPMAGFRHTGVGVASARNHYGVVSQIQDGAYVHGTAAGTADALTLNITPSVTAYVSGMTFTFKAAADNTGAATLNVDAVGAKAIRKVADSADAALAAGDIQDNGIYTVTYDEDANSAAGAWILQNPHAVLVSSGFVLGSVQVITSSSTWTKPAGCRRVVLEGVGGGGGGGGVIASGAGNASGGGGHSGAYGKTGLIDVSGIASSTVTIGAAGAAGATGNNNGSAGGDTIWNDGTNTFTWEGGDGGAGRTASSAFSIFLLGSPGGVSGAGLRGAGWPGTPGVTGFNSSSSIGSYGGSNSLGRGAVGPIVSAATAGNAGSGFGAGGSGGTITTASSSAGGAGTVGILIVWEYY